MVGIFLLVVSVYFVSKNLRQVEMVIRNAGILGPLVAVLLYGVFAPTPITTDPLTVISGVVFGPILGIIVSWMGNNLAAFIEYFAGKRLSKVKEVNKFKKRLPFNLDRFPISSPLVLIFGRMIPGYGGKIISVMAGMYEVPLFTYIWTTMLVNLSGSVLLSFGGYNIIHIVKDLIH